MALHRFALIACLVGLVLPACTQDEDEACQVNTDCADGLVCSISSLSQRGTCRPPDELNMDDAGGGGAGGETVDPDASVRDGALDDDAG